MTNIVDPNDKNKITDKDILNAKEHSIEDFIEVNYGGFATCLFHNDKSPSMKVFADNRFKCFSCQEKGDVIDIVMELYKTDFIGAVKKILGK